MVALKLQEYLEAHAITQSALAREMRCSRQYVGQLVRGYSGIQLRQLGRLCDCLAHLGHPCRPEQLFLYVREAP